jgi:DMSO/TMAO reductase YedYZ molybdopterin-dependent catalytic subunit
MKKHPGISILLIVAIALSTLPLMMGVSVAREASATRGIDSSTGATPNYRTFQTNDLQTMPNYGGNYSILKSKPPYTYFNQDWYGVKLSYLLDVEVGLKAGTTGIKFLGADGYSATLTPAEMRNANSQGLFAVLAWKKGAVNKTGGPYTPLDTAEGPFRMVTPQTPNTGPYPGGSPNWQKSVSQVRAIEIDPTPPGLPAVDPATVPEGEVLVYGNILDRRTFTVNQLKSIKQFTGRYHWERYGETGYENATGIPLGYFMDSVVGTLPGATNINVVASDTFQQTFTLAEIRNKPNGLPWLLAWNVSGPLTPEPGRGPIMSVKPQSTPMEGNKEFWIRNVRVVQVEPIGTTPMPDPTLVPSDRIIVCGQCSPKNVPNFWYLAEGYTGGGFEEYVCVANPNSWQTRVIITYMIEGQDNKTQEFQVAARSRATVRVNDIVGADKNVSTMVEGYHGDSITVERAMYWNNRSGGHCAAAVSTPAKDWYLAEGCTGNGFETWVLLQNPGDAAANATVTYMNETGSAAGPTVNLPAKSRKTVKVADTLPNDVQVSTKVAADQPIIAERAMYWNNRRAGTCAAGLNQPGTDWYLAEGSTGGGFETWVLVQNPGDAAAKVNLTYMNEKGPQAGPVLNLPAHSRTSVNVASTLPDDWQVSTAMTSDQPIVAERAVYWNGRAGGHDETAVDSPKFRSFLAEGSTAGGFESWILIQNPGPSDATVYIVYLTENGAKERAPLALPAGKRVSINEVDDVGSMWQVSANISATAPVAVERAMYWAGRAADGSCSHGYPTW